MNEHRLAEIATMTLEQAIAALIKECGGDFATWEYLGLGWAGVPGTSGANLAPIPAPVVGQGPVEGVRAWLREQGVDKVRGLLRGALGCGAMPLGGAG